MNIQLSVEGFKLLSKFTGLLAEVYPGESISAEHNYVL